MTRTLADFEGVWRIVRRIDDRWGGTVPHLDGTATFTPDNGGLVQDEAGVLHLPGAGPMTSTRRYLWRPAPHGIAVTFATGLPFHVFDPDADAPVARHACAPDLYVVRYDFTAWPCWSATWTVSGPRKDYDSVTDYRR